MAIFSGTPNPDFFAGADGVADTFRFLPQDLTFEDFVSGGVGNNGDDINDILQLLGPGELTQIDLAGVSGIERITMSAGTSLDLTQNMFLTARNNTINVTGSGENDILYGDAAVDTGSLIFNPGAGSDIFIGTGGNDVVRINAADVDGRDIFNAALGEDTLTFTSGGTVGQLANFFGFERINLHADGNLVELTQGMVGSVDVDQFRVFGGAGEDIVNAFAASGNVSFNGGGGTSVFDGGSGNDRATGGAATDIFYGHDGNDTLHGMGAFDLLHGGAGDNFIDGGEGDDQLLADEGKTTFVGGPGADTITVQSSDTKMDYVRYRSTAEGGDTIVGSAGGILTENDLGFQFSKTGPSPFSTLGNNFNKIVKVDGLGSGPLADGADVVLFNDGGAGLATADQVNQFFFDNYFASSLVGAFFLNFDNDTGKTSLYYDTNAFSIAFEAVLLAEIEGWNAAALASLDKDNFSLV